MLSTTINGLSKKSADTHALEPWTVLKWFRRGRRRGPPVDLPPAAADQAADHLLAMDSALEALAELRPLDPIRAHGQVPPGFDALWSEALAAYDRYVELCLAQGEGGQPVEPSCGEGCPGCCQRPPQGVSPVEVLHILHRAPQLAAEVRFTGSGPCSFLDEDGRCRIYPLRPLACRMHFSRSDPQLCWPGHPRARRARLLDLAVPEEIEADLERVATNLGLASLSDDLGRALLELRDEILEGRTPTEAPAPRRNPRRSREP